MADEDNSNSNSNNEQVEMAKWLIFAIAIGSVLVLVPLLSRVKRTRGTKLLYHVIYVVVATILLVLVPESFQDIVFSESGVLVLGTFIPIYESIVAVCTFGESDDLEWLQFWVVNATFTYATEFMDTIADNVPFVADHWYEFEFFITLWFLLPWTDGSTLLYDTITKPLLAPLFQKGKLLMDGKFQIIFALVNSGYLWIVWMAFMTLPEEARRFVVIAVGTVYPMMASTAAITTKNSKNGKSGSINRKDDDGGAEETFWLTYWACYSILFVAMDYAETFVGTIKGFYSICLVATVYLFLPMFRGAEQVFRNILVPLTGQYENMLLRDTLLVRREMEKNISPKYIKSTRVKAAELFLNDHNE
mmetsp:Transcript_9523/g.15848  ORF Transcript_9523/g.15848 Transcript_9523/m.15848 type:complete len:361 (+) Transcript_9523:132-1214(+)|eukprot:CAMPEP_0119007320 /NCGR_PEP_ID=MMETSP1176-20130426/2929_1 /TAXON_ID=265551 /ORGANISM="Synedropsis recta cf, Strain CCMP1620" /LENGTH=360 /DNA_ID=CAMNT_0006959443 /DNA_START=126 /DNA_END=1208 /DNA_ORIENTATION=-